MGRSTRLLNWFIALVFIFASFAVSPPQPAAAWQSRVDPWLLQQAAASPGGVMEFLVYLAQQADLSGAAALHTKQAKGAFVFERLTQLAQRTQKPLVAALEAQGVDYRPYWIANMIWVRGDASLIQRLAQRADVAHIYANPQIRLAEPPPDSASLSRLSPEAIEPNLLQVNADKVWAAGYTGQGVVIGGQDTGYDWTHPALKNQYRGWDGTNADHNYNWHDAIHSGGGSCGADSLQPCDDYGHGTHTMGTMLGDDGAGNQVGMAPGARWIGCRNMNVGVGSPATYSECFQWFLAPTDLLGNDPHPDLAPDVINNSWSCPSSEGCSWDSLQTVVANTRAAGIVVVVSAGNSGPACSSMIDPPAIYSDSFTVGATDSSDNIASFSNRGPVSVDGSGRLKPDISAPGVGIRSSIPGGGYGLSSGTSMAAPHVTGLVALLISAEPALRGQVDEIEQVIEQSSLPRAANQSCGGVPGSQIPNNTYGWGRIDAYAAYQATLHHLSVSKKASAAQVEPGGTLTYTLTVTHTHYLSPTTNVLLTDTLPAETAFITATVPFNLNGSTVQWSFPSLAANVSRSVELVVRAPITQSIIIENANYGAISDDVTIPVTGTAVTTLVIHTIQHTIYFPFLIQSGFR